MSTNPQMGPVNNNYMPDSRVVGNQVAYPNQSNQNKPIVRFTSNAFEPPRNDIAQAKKSSPDASSK